MVVGFHTLLYSKDPDATREFLRATLRLESVDAGRGWLIFAQPPSELAVHPAEAETRPELYLMCDDLDSTIQEMVDGAAEVVEPTHVERWGKVTSIRIPGDVIVGLYEPLHPTALHLTSRSL